MLRSHSMRWLAPGVLAGMCLVGIPAAQAASPSGSPGDPDTVSAAIDRADSQPKGAISAPSNGVDPAKGAHAVSAGVVADAPATADGRITVASRYGDRTLTLGLPAHSKAPARVAGSGTITYADGGVDIGVRVFESGVQVSTVISTPQADHTFSYPVSLPSGARIEKLPDGGVIFLTADGSPLGGFAAAWAKDAHGAAVATWYEIAGTSVVQHVQVGPASAYPVVADPYLWIDLIKTASWVYHAGYGWTLQVTPTTWARINAGGYLIGVYDWNELYSKYKNHGLNTNLGGMRDQMICHQQVVAVVSPGKSTWNLDEWRPDVSYAQTVNASCNPGGTKWFD